MLSPVPIAPQNIQEMRDCGLTFDVAVRPMAIAGTLPSYLYQKEIHPSEPLSLNSDYEEQRKKKTKRKIRY